MARTRPRRYARTAPLLALQPRPLTPKEIAKMTLEAETEAAMFEVRRLRGEMEKADGSLALEKLDALVAAHARVQASIAARIRRLEETPRTDAF